MSNIIDTLIYDRTQADVDRVFLLKNKALRQGWASLTPDEQAEYLGGMKGAYNYTDLNRVGQAVSYLADRMTDLPVELATYRDAHGVAYDPSLDVPYNPDDVVVTPKTDWAIEDDITQSLATTYLQNLEVLREQLTLPTGTPEVPSSLDKLTHTTANDIEFLLFVIDTALCEVENNLYSKINLTISAFAYANLYHCGE